MPLSFRRLFPLLAGTFSFAAVAPAQFSPYGSATINTSTTAAQTLASGTGTITSSGSINDAGTSVALTLSGTNTTLLNYGSIYNTNANATGSSTTRALRADGTNLQITNETGGVIQSTGDDTVRSSTAGTSITFTNNGTITALNTSTSSPQQAVDWNSITTGANTFNNYGTVQATGNDAIRPGVNGVVNNFSGGSITSANTTLAAAISAGNGLSSDGIDAQTNSGVQVTNSGTISGGRHGITGGNTTGTGAYAMSITNNANATIQGNNGSGVNIDGINGNEVVTVVNNGTITGNVTALNSGETAHDGDGVDVDGLVNLTNTGTIQSLNAINDTSEGVTVGGGTIMNSGTILGTVNGTNNGTGTGKGITILGIDSVNPITAMYGNTVITNSGTIRGTTNSGITIGYSSTTPVTASGFTSTINNLPGGTIEGGGATAAAIQTGPDNDTINNSGAIIADTSNLAIDMGAGNNTLNITGGSASITGNVSGGTGGTNTLTISPGSGKTFTYSGSFSNFATTQIQSGRVTFSGASTYTGTTTVASGATLVANTPAAAGSATGSGAVTVQSGGTLAGTGQVAGGVTVAGGGSLSPGDNGVGTLSLGSNLNVSNGSSLNYELGADELHSDRLTLAGTLAFSGSGQLTFNLTDDGLMPGTYDLIDFASSTGLTTANLGFGTVPNGFSGTFVLTDTEISVVVNAVPEPSTWAMWVAAAVILLAWQRRTQTGTRD